MKLRIPDYACLYHDGKPSKQKPNPCGAWQKGDKIEFDNCELKSQLSSEDGKIWFELDNDELKVFATTWFKASDNILGVMAQSVVMKESIVAIFICIIPLPLHIPATVTVLPPITSLTAKFF